MAERYIDGIRKTSNGCDVAKRVPRSETNFRVPSKNVAAIDFGTTHCSVAYITATDSFERGPRTLLLNGDSPREPTAVLFKPDGSLLSFGHDARLEYLNLDDARRPDYAYFEEIKMKLQMDEDVNRDMTILAANGQEYHLVDVIAQVLKYLKSELLKVLRRAEHPLKVTDFDWVITVPAIWKARGKQMMREAGYKAGLCSEEECGKLSLELMDAPQPSSIRSPEILLLALEPESAAVHCHSQSQRLMDVYGPQAVSSTGGYLLVDIGGGTVDISVYNVVNAGQLCHVEIVQPPSGKSCGGSRVNEWFRKFLDKLVDDLGFYKYVSSDDNQKNVKHRAYLNELVNQTFEKQKTLFGARESGDTRGVTIRLHETFATVYREDLETGADRDPDVTLRGKQTLVLSQGKMESFFKPVLNEILECIRDVLHTLEDQITTVYIVGGFGGSPYLRCFLESQLGPRYHCVVPEEPQFSVVQGAAMFGANPQIVHARAADATYGIKVSAKFDPTKHHEEYRFPDDEQVPYCRNLFSTIVEKGDLICTEHVFTSTFYPVFRNQTSMSISVYCSPEKDVWYVTGRAGREIQTRKSIKTYMLGKFTVQMPNMEGDKARKVEVVFDFRHTEIQIRGFDKTSKKSVAVVVDFLSSQRKDDPSIAVADQ